MTEFILKIYDWIRSRKLFGVLSFVIVTGVLVALALHVRYKEDISDFLPLDAQQSEDMEVFREISGSEGIFAVFQYRNPEAGDPDEAVDAIDAFADLVEENDTEGMVTDLMSQVDLGTIAGTMDFVCSNIPYFLTNADYERIDSLLAVEDFVKEQLRSDKQMLMFPAGSFVSDNIRRDPLNLFTPVLQSLQTGSGSLKYEMYNGCIFSPDMQKAFVMMSSPFGSSETEHNAKLVGMLRGCADEVESSFDNIEVHIIGGPVIAVGNASRIKTDSILAVSLALFLILALLFFAFRKLRNLLLIALTIAWGWLFGLGCLSLIDRNISIIILGISSVVIGIAVNYPLHLIAHFSHASDRRSAVRDIVYPLLVGNITTVGAFLALVPLHSTAMRDLGLFSAFLLVGTIIFTLIWLPHVAIAKQNIIPAVFSRIGNIRLENKAWLVWTIVVLTVVLGFFSLRTKFDANIANINYMTAEQKADMEYFYREMLRETSAQKVYAVAADATMDGALDRSMSSQDSFRRLEEDGLVVESSGCGRFLCSKAEQSRRLELWYDFISRHLGDIETALRSEGEVEGFSDRSFNEFYAILNADYEPMPFDHFAPLAQSVFSDYYISDPESGRYNVVDILSVEPENVAEVEARLREDSIRCFDVTSLNSAAAGNLSSDFNYIGWACGCIVFFFLWLAFGSIELAIISFIPMAVSWLWILGLMAIFGMQFNIVNIILATFIFGQGDDYTIFMTEGASYEYAYRRKILGSYKSSIIMSALIMFIGIGTLILAKHPAMHSLAEVTIVGMVSVVLMAYIFPPFIYRWLVSARGRYRMRPLTLRSILVAIMGYIGIGFRLLSLRLRRAFASEVSVRRHAVRAVLSYLRHIPGVKFELRNPYNEDFASPAVFVISCSLPRALRRICMLSKGVLVPEENVSEEEFFESVSRQSSAARAEVVPIVIHGLDIVFPGNGLAASRGRVTVEVGRRFSGSTGLEEYIKNEYFRLASEIETVRYWRDFVVDRYRYKGYEITGPVVRNLRKYDCYSEWIDGFDGSDAGTASDVIVKGGGYGEFPLLFALAHRSVRVTAVVDDPDRADVLKYCAEGVADNLSVVGSLESAEVGEGSVVYVVGSSGNDEELSERSGSCRIVNIN